MYPTYTTPSIKFAYLQHSLTPSSQPTTTDHPPIILPALLHITFTILIMLLLLQHTTNNTRNSSHSSTRLVSTPYTTAQRSASAVTAHLVDHPKTQTHKDEQHNSVSLSSAHIAKLPSATFDVRVSCTARNCKNQDHRTLTTLACRIAEKPPQTSMPRVYETYETRCIRESMQVVG